jgi:hypothetical protein
MEAEMPLRRLRPGACRTGLLCLALLAPFTGCSTKAQRQTKFMRTVEVTDLSTSELRFRSYEFARFSASVVEAAADEIMAETDDPHVRHNALVWKTNAIPTMYAATFRTDPLLGFWDGWVLSAQMRAYLTDGAGSDLFGDWQSVAIRAADEIFERAATMARNFQTSGDLTGELEFIDDWVRDHPVTGLSFRREPTAVAWVDYLGFDEPGGIAAAASIDAQVADLQARMNIYAEHLPKQARWQAQILASGYVETEHVSRFLANVDVIEEQIRALRTSVDSMEAVFTDIQGILHEEVGVLTDDLTFQREAAFDQIDEMRLAAMADLRAEADRMLDLVRGEREAVMADLEGLTSTLIEDAVDRFDRLANRLFWRFTAVVAIAAAIVVAAFFYTGRKKAASV